jgi:uncharacterized protein (TIGR04255 family)
MARERHLRSAPIIEAVVDFRAALPSGFNPETLRSISDRLSGKYPKIAESKRFATKLEWTQRGPSQQTEDLGVQGILAKTQDELTWAQFRIDGFTLNRLKPYTSWEEIRPEALRLWEVYVNLTRPIGVARVALRYINRMDLPAVGHLEDYVVTGPTLPLGVPSEISYFATRTVLDDLERRISANVVQEFGPNAEPPSAAKGVPGYAMLLDIDAFKTGDFTPGETNFKDILDDLHAYKNGIFFGSLTDPFVETFE